MNRSRFTAAFATVAALLLTACAAPGPGGTAGSTPGNTSGSPTGSTQGAAAGATPSAQACPAPAPCPACQACPGTAKPEPPAAPTLEPAQFSELPGWDADNHAEALAALRRSCETLRRQPAWVVACGQAALTSPADAKRFFEAQFAPWRAAEANGSTVGLVTGYYEPVLRGSRERRAPFLHPLYAPPEDLLVVDLAGVNPDVANMRLRGRIEGRRIVPYWSRAQIEAGRAPVRGKELVWLDDPVEAFFMEVQGSGRIELPDGTGIRLGYADQNGHPYQSIGRVLVERGEMKLSDASMQGIKAWARANPGKVRELLDCNPSYVFFRELPVDLPGPLGAMGLPLSTARSIAIDPRYIPLGAPVFLATTQPLSEVPLNRLMLAQDTGGAIRGAVRADFFWGTGAEAGTQAGRMRQQGRMWVLWPVGQVPRGAQVPGQAPGSATPPG